MMTVAAMGGGAGRYYMGLTSGSGYYVEAPEPDGFWFGSGAPEIGLEGVVTGEALENIMAGYSADRLLSLVRNAGAEDRDIGWDICLSVPKSTSILFAIGDEATRQHVTDATHAAFRRTIRYLEENACFTRRGKGGCERIPAKPVIACFEHAASRGNADPQLHLHALFLNVCTAKDGKTRTMESWPLYMHKMTAGAVFRQELAHELTHRLGVRLRQEGTWFEVVGVPQDLMDEFSTRRKQIERILEEQGFASASAAEIANLMSRTSKNQPSRSELFKQWQAVCEKYGLTPEIVNEVLKGQATKLNHDQQKGVCEQAVNQSLQGITEHQSHFSERELLRATLEKTQGLDVTVDVVEQVVGEQLERHQEVVRLGRLVKTERQFTTREMLQKEASLLETIDRAVDQQAASVDPKTLEKVKQELLPHELRPEQEQAFEYICTSPSRVKLVSGVAGSGKSFTLRACREAFEAEGYRCVGTTLAGRIADEMQHETGIPTDTVASFLIKLENQNRELAHQHPQPILTDKTVLFIDEAALSGTRQLEKINREAEKAGATVVHVGQAEQLQPILSGNAFAVIKDHVPHVELRHITRQREAWARAAVHDFTAGNAERGLAAYAERGRVTVEKNQRKAMDRLIEDFVRDGGLATPQERMILTGAKVDAIAINRRLQARQRAQEAEQGIPRMESLQVKDEILERNDRVIFTRNNRFLGVRNGQLGIVKDVNADLKTLTVETDHGKTVSFSTETYDNITLGFSTNTHKRQGGTADAAYVFISDTGMQDKHLSLVQASRHRESLRWYTSEIVAGPDFTKLTQRMSQDHTKLLASQLLPANTASRYRESTNEQRRDADG